MRRASTVLSLSLAAAGLMTAGSAHALGFGRVANATQLGQRLNFAALVRLDPDEALERQCVFAEVMAGDNLLQPGQVRVTLEGGVDVPDRTVRVTTSTVIDEPVVSVTVTVGCTFRTTRKFVVFVDPPGIELAQATPADSALLLPQRADSQVAPLRAIVAAETSTPAGQADSSPPPFAPPVANPGPPRPPRPPADAGPSAPRRSVAAAASPVTIGEPSADRKPAPVRRSANAGAGAARPTAGGRLQLEAPAALTAAAPTHGGSGTPSMAASAQMQASAPDSTPVVATGPASAPAGNDAQALLLAREQQRIQSLEDSMTRMRADAAATQKALAALQARLHAAESERNANPLALALAALSGLLATALVGLLWRRSGAPKAAHWWAGAPPAGDAALGVQAVVVPGTAIDASRPVAMAATVATLQRPEEDLPEKGVPVTAAEVSLPGLAATSPRWAAAASRAPAVATDRDGPAIAVSAAMPLVNESTGELSVEELIDLEQQAEFFVVLGQDDAAIELLTTHIQGDGVASPLPCLKLLEIHRRRGDREGYESIRTGFNQRFNAYAPDWNADLQQGRALEEYPAVIERLQRLWITPAQAMETLDASVFRRNRSDETFDLPAYRELLFLYTIARDQAEQGAADRPSSNPHVDLLLPLNSASDHAADPIFHLNATGSEQRPEFEHSARVMLPLDLDVDVSFAAERRPARPGPSASVKVKAAAAGAGAASSSSSVAPVATSSSPAGPYYEGAETVPAALRRPVGYPDESAFVDLEFEPVGGGDHAGVV